MEQILMSAGLAIIGSSTVMLAAQVRGRSLSHRSLFRDRLKPKRRGEPLFTKTSVTAAVLMAVLLAGIGRNLEEIFLFAATGALLGLTGTRLYRRLKKRLIRTERLREISVLFRSFQYYKDTNLSTPQALRLAALHAPGIARTANRCADYWSINPQLALEQLRRDLEIEEAEVLVSLLALIEESGTRHMDGVLKKEADNIERLRQLKIKQQQKARPIYLLLSRVLPMAVTFGIMAGPLVVKIMKTLHESGINPW